MLYWLFCLACMLVPMVLLAIWIKSDQDGKYLSEDKSRSLEWLGALVALFTLGACILAYLGFFIDFERIIYYPAGLALLGLVYMFYPTGILKQTRLMGVKLDMWDHLRNRKEVIFPWEFKPVASSLAIVFYVCGLAALVVATFMLLTLKLVEGSSTISIVSVVLLFVGLYICYLMFKPKTA